MRILVVHNYYRSAAPSGENVVFEAERDLLRERGHDVVEFTRTSDVLEGRPLLGPLRGALATPWNPFAVRAIRRAIEREKPDVMHVHNTFPLLSPAIFRAARGTPTATVATLHNYRNFCAAAVLTRESAPCTRCLDERSALPAIRYGCYRGSRLATAPLAAMAALHRRAGTWNTDVDRFIALTEFQRGLLVRAGLRPKSVRVKPHFLASPAPPIPWGERDASVLFIGRLGPEKGVRCLVEAWRRWGDGAPPLDLIGDGPERSALEALAAGRGGETRIAFRGRMAFADAQARLARARLLVLPSVCIEGFPMVIREAYAAGVPVAASRLGPLPELVRDGVTGVLFEAGNPEDLRSRVAHVWSDQPRLSEMAQAARREFDARYTAEVGYRRLMEIYEEAIGARRERGKARG